MRHIEERLLRRMLAAGGTRKRRSGKPALTRILFEVLGEDESLDAALPDPTVGALVDAGCEGGGHSGVRARVGGLDDGEHLRRRTSSRKERARSTRRVKSRAPSSSRSLIELVSRGQLTGGRTSDPSVGFFQIGGGIAGDFADLRRCRRCISQDLRRDDVPVLGILRVRSRTTQPSSYGGYSGAVPPTRRSRGANSTSTRRSS